MTDQLRLAAACAVTLLLTACAQAQSLAPLFPSKEYVQLDGQTVAIENTLVPDVGNNGFEAANLSAWPGWNGSDANLTTSTAHTGAYSVLMSGPGNSGVSQDVGGLTPGQQYVVSAWVNVSTGATAELYLDDTISPSTTQIAVYAQTNGWQLISLPFLVDSTGKIRIHLWSSSGSGAIYWDDVSVVRAVTLGNYGFESGNLSSWITWDGCNASVITNLVHSGFFAMMMTGTAGIYQDIDGLVPSQQYVVSAWVNVIGATAELYLDDALSTASTEIAYQGQTSGWQYISLPFTVDSTGKLRIHFWFGSPSGTIYWDDVSVIPAIPVGNSVSNSET